MVLLLVNELLNSDELEERAEIRADFLVAGTCNSYMHEQHCARMHLLHLINEKLPL